MKGQNPQKKQSIYTGQLYRDALIEALKKFAPRKMVRNPVMFVVEVVSVLTTGFWIQALLGKGEAPAGFIGHISLWLWFTVLFANYAEALAEGRGKAQAEALKRMRKQTQAKRLPKGYLLESHAKPETAGYSWSPRRSCARGTCILLRRGIPFLPMGRSWRGLPRLTRAPLRGKAPRSFANRGETAVRSPEGRGFFPTG